MIRTTHCKTLHLHIILKCCSNIHADQVTQYDGIFHCTSPLGGPRQSLNMDLLRFSALEQSASDRARWYNQGEVKTSIRCTHGPWSNNMCNIKLPHCFSINLIFICFGISHHAQIASLGSTLVSLVRQIDVLRSSKAVIGCLGLETM